MKRVSMEHRLCVRILAMLLVICMTAGLAWTVSAAYPTHTDYIYDGAEVLSASLKETIKSTNEALYNKVKTRISVCIVESLGGEEIHTYSRNIFSEWKLGEGVLLVISTGDENYYAVQSTSIDGVLTNAQLDSILKEFMEPDFAEGNVSRGIQKTINKLASFLKSELPSAGTDNTQSEQTGENDGEEKSTFGSVILSILQILGWTVVVLAAAFVIFFVIALFNDTAAELMNRLVFSHFTGKKKAPANRDYYDERLYGRPQNGQRRQGNGNAPQQRPRQNGQQQMYNRYQQGGVRYDDEYYGSRHQNRSPQQNQQRPQTRQSNPDYEQTRQVIINNRNRNSGSR